MHHEQLSERVASQTADRNHPPDHAAAVLAVRKTLPDAQGIVKRFNAQILTMMVDRTYHRLLHLDWISSDVDGDGVADYVPRSDRVDSAPAQKACAISVRPRSPVRPRFPTDSSATSAQRRKSKFYVGGNMRFDLGHMKSHGGKVPDPDAPDAEAARRPPCSRSDGEPTRERSSRS